MHCGKTEQLHCGKTSGVQERHSLKHQNWFKLVLEQWAGHCHQGVKSTGGGAETLGADSPTQEVTRITPQTSFDHKITGNNFIININIY